MDELTKEEFDYVMKTTEAKIQKALKLRELRMNAVNPWPELRGLKYKPFKKKGQTP
jgi:hypothetical protein